MSRKIEFDGVRADWNACTPFDNAEMWAAFVQRATIRVKVIGDVYVEPTGVPGWAVVRGPHGGEWWVTADTAGAL